MVSTKIVASLGPASFHSDILKKMYAKGMRVARINTSFPNVQEVSDQITFIRTTVPDCALLIDLQGYKIRIQGLDQPKILQSGDQIYIAANDTTVQNTSLPVLLADFPSLFAPLHKGVKLHIDEGKIIVKVLLADPSYCLCEVIEGGEVKNRKTINVPGIILDFPTLSEKDKQIIALAKQKEAEFIAMSFVRSADDVKVGRSLLAGSLTKIISKIENVQGLNNFAEILQASDGIMIARGDLGVETPLEEVPLWQKKMIKMATKIGKPIITATHMMESMITTIVPTRAEVSDVANAILDGTDALMLSGETAVGNHPVETVAEMARIAKVTERKVCNISQNEKHVVGKPITNAIARAIIQVCDDLGIKTILVFTSSGTTARAIASFRPHQKIFAFTSQDIITRQLNLTFGVHAYTLNKKSNNRSKIIDEMLAREVQDGAIEKGQLVLVVSGANTLHQGSTNTLEVQEVK